jgi:hypothetical protein
MKRNKRNQQAPQKAGAMVAMRIPGRLIRGGTDVPIEDWKQLRAAHRQGERVLPPCLVMVDEHAPGQLSPAMTVLDDLVRKGHLNGFLRAFFGGPSKEDRGTPPEVAGALMLDLFVAGQSDGWVCATGEVLASPPGKFEEYCWIEYRGWTVDAAGGLVKIYAAPWFRSVFSPRNLILRDAGQMLEMLKGRSSGAAVEALDRLRPAQTTAQVYDTQTKKVVTMPVSELAPGMMKARVYGVEGLVWVDTTRMSQNDTYFHPPFPPKTRQQIAWIANVLHDVHPLSVREWEDIFRKELSADRQIFIHTCAAETFKRLTEGGDWSLPQKRDLYMAIMHIGCGSEEEFLATFVPATITNAEAVAAAKLFNAVYLEKGGPEKLRAWDSEMEIRMREIQDDRSGKSA